MCVMCAALCQEDHADLSETPKTDPAPPNPDVPAERSEVILCKLLILNLIFADLISDLKLDLFHTADLILILLLLLMCSILGFAY